MVRALPLTTDERYGPCVRFATVIMPCGHEKADMLGKIQAFAMPNSPQSEIASSQQTPRWREVDSNHRSPFPRLSSIRAVRAEIIGRSTDLFRRPKVRRL